MSNFEKKYPHMLFRKHWKISAETYFQLGQCDAILKAITNTPIRPDFRKLLHKVALIKGAQATTAIEGNTLSYDEIEAVEKGERLQPSRAYLEQEVKNILEAFNGILERTLVDQDVTLIDRDLILKFHYMVGKDLGKYFEAVPGKLRDNNVVVGYYKAPEKRDVPELVDRLCEWLKQEFHYDKGQTFTDSIIQAIVIHIYIAWIHPFSDGNGRTARLLEYYFLLRAGVPDIASHVLSNFYNYTRSEYYRQIANATKKKDLSEFIAYAILGFRDELIQILDTIQENQLLITWRNYIYGIFDSHKGTGRAAEAIKRRRKLILEIPHNKWKTDEEIVNSRVELVKMYSKVSDRTLQRDLEDLIEQDLVVKEDDKYRAKIEVLTVFMAFKLDGTRQAD